MTKKKHFISNIFLIFMITLGFLTFFSALWYLKTYSSTGFAVILFTLFSNLSGVEADLLINYSIKALLPTVICVITVSLLLFYNGSKVLYIQRRRKQTRTKVYPMPRWSSVSVSLFLSVSLITVAAVNVELPEYIMNLFDKTTLYEEYYIEPNSLNVSFPEKKRNLIYIFMESLETSFLEDEPGRNIDTNLLPGLTSLANKNINFSQNDSVGGFRSINGSDWTIASIVSQTSGVPLTIPIDGNSYGTKGVFLPGITNLSDILNENGYTQALMVGSNSDFGGRKTYFSTHGTDYIYDIFTAQEEGIVPKDYFVWWGMEDLYLYKYAQQKITELSNSEQPFAFTMLTVDTHHVGGYVCPICNNNRSEQYENVYMCADKQISAFIEWIKKQDFYDNTTIVICGDHPSMDADYFNRNFSPDYIRRIYNCIINSAATTEFTKNREFTAIDLFPTTLAALGCTLSQNRLGLGVNLFSGEPTLSERLGFDTLNDELQKSSRFYNKFT